MHRTILHVDMDAFFAAIEAREDPTIAERPIVVGADPRGGRGRGVVAACNYEAREYGIHSAMPISEAYRRCPDAAYLPVRGGLYAEVSERIMAVLESYTDLVEPLSIDEAFLDVTGSLQLFGGGATIARRIKSDIREREGLTASVGVAPNKFLAKLASEIEKPDGLVVVDPGEVRDFLRPLPIQRLWGVGAKTAERLRRLGIGTIGDVADFPVTHLEATLGRALGQRLHRLATGQDDRPVQPDRERKQIGREMTFDSDTWDRDEVRRTLLGLIDEVAQRLRRRGATGRTITLKLRLAPFDTLTRQRKTESAVATTEALYPIALELLADADPGDRPIRLIGISVSDLRAAEDRQLSLFAEDEPDRNARRVAEALDRITARFGRHALRRARLLRAKSESTPDGDEEDA